jgi:hypothetical protein
VAPFYPLNLWRDGEIFVRALRPVCSQIDEQLVKELLSYFNWRPRLVGAYFVAVRRLAGLEQQIGRLLLRSDVCEAGRGYCVALARLNTGSSAALLMEYLDYYLTRADLWFDQGFAMAALGYLDHENGTHLREGFVGRWHDFIANKPNWDLTRNDEIFELTVRAETWPVRRRRRGYLVNERSAGRFLTARWLRLAMISLRAMLAQLQLLVSARRNVDDPRQRARAAQTHIGKQVYESVDTLGRKQRAVRAAMTLLTAALALRFPAPMTRCPTACI